MMFVEFNKRVYRNGGYITTKIMLNLDDISRIVECSDDWHFTNIITKDGEIHTITDEYSDVAKEIKKAMGE